MKLNQEFRCVSDDSAPLFRRPRRDCPQPGNEEEEEEAECDPIN